MEDRNRKDNVKNDKKLQKRKKKFYVYLVAKMVLRINKLIVLRGKWKIIMQMVKSKLNFNEQVKHRERTNNLSLGNMDIYVINFICKDFDFIHPIN